jgi:putative SOS response-associated peptidase YedK
VVFDAEDDTGDALAPSWNVAPTDPVPIVRASNGRADRRADERVGRRSVAVARWGLRPVWAAASAKGRSFSMINARAETVATAPAYRAAFARRRCLVPADGWYEWQRRPDGPGKQPYFMCPAGAGGPVVFAGLWEPGGESGPATCAVVTLAAAGPLRAVHDRMPLLLPPERWATWLGEEPVADPAELLAAPVDAALAALELRPVGTAVGDVRNNGPSLCAPVEPPAPEPVDLTLF